MALDRAGGRVFVPAFGNGGYRVFDLDSDGLPKTRRATHVIGRPTLFGRRSVVPPSAREPAFPGAIAEFDSSTQRLFAADLFNNRILVFGAARAELTPFPAARTVIGQPNFTSRTIGLTGPNKFGFLIDTAIDEEHQRLFAADLLNHRVLVFDIHPDRLQNDPVAEVVLGQETFFTSGLTGAREPGPDTFNGPSSVEYDPQFERLFVADSGNNRVLVFDAAPERLQSGASATAVMGQEDFNSREPREDPNQLEPPGSPLEGMSYDWVHHRLFIGEGGDDLEHRVLVFDAHPDRVGGPATAIAVIGQPDAQGTRPAVSRTRVTMPRPVVEPTTQKLYVSEGFPGGNRVVIFDIRPEKLRTGMPAVDVIGHTTPDGEPDFDNRMAQGHLDGRSLAAARAVALDPVDHRLFVADQYNHRVVVWRLDRQNRVVDRDAIAVLGQPSLRTSRMRDANARNMASPLAVAYDKRTKRLYVGDGIHNRVLIYDARPGRLRNGMRASAVLGQKSFTTVRHAAGRSGLDFDVRGGRGIASTFIPMGLAVDEAGQRLFVSDGGNNRILVYDVSASQLRRGMPASVVLGQADFEATEPGGGPARLREPGHLAFDATHQRLFAIDALNFRVMVFDVAPERLMNGAPAVRVIGQEEFGRTSSPDNPLLALLAFQRLQVEPLPPVGVQAPPPRGDRLSGPNGIAYDEIHEVLYVADAGGLLGGGAHRVVVFDAAPERLENGPEAIRVLGKSSVSEGPPVRQGGASSYPGQFTLHDPRGIALDPVNGVLFVTDSLTSRVVVYHFPRAAWRYRVPGGHWLRLSTLDAVDLEREAQPRTVTAASVTGGVKAGAVHYVTSGMQIDERTQRHRRAVTSEAAVPASQAVSKAAFWVDEQDRRTHTIALRNPGDSMSEATFRHHDRNGEVRAEQTVEVAPGQQVVLKSSDLLGGMRSAGTLAMNATVPIAVTVLRETTNQRGEVLLTRAPGLHGPDMPGRRTTLPLVVDGSQRSSQVILLNTGDERARGSIKFFDARGRRHDLGMPDDRVRYSLPPRGSTVIGNDGGAGRDVAGYAEITATAGPAPFAAGLVTSRRGEVLISETLVSSGVSAPARFAVDTEPTLVRHGDVRSRVHVVNAGSRKATARFTLTGHPRRVVRTLRPRARRSFTVERLFGEDTVFGVVTVTSRRPVTVTWQQTTRNLRGEPITVELPALERVRQPSFPYVLNGAGAASEFRLANPRPTRARAVTATGQLRFHTPDGEPASDTLLSVGPAPARRRARCASRIRTPRKLDLSRSRRRLPIRVRMVRPCRVTVSLRRLPRRAARRISLQLRRSRVVRRGSRTLVVCLPRTVRPGRYRLTVKLTSGGKRQLVHRRLRIVR